MAINPVVRIDRKNSAQATKVIRPTPAGVRYAHQHMMRKAQRTRNQLKLRLKFIDFP